MQFVFIVSQAIQTATRSLVTLGISRFVVMCHRLYSNIFTSSQEMCSDHNSAVKTVTAFFYWDVLFGCDAYLGHFCLRLTENCNVDICQHDCKRESFFKETVRYFQTFQWAVCVMGGISLTHIHQFFQQLSCLSSWWVWSPHTPQSSIALLHVLGQAEVKLFSICLTPMTSVRLSLKVTD